MVEDQPEVREVLALMVRRFGYRVLLAADGIEALACWDEEPADIGVVLSDIMMPRMNGPMLARELRERDPRVQIVFCSGYSARSSGPAGWDEVEEVVLRKPIRLGLLQEALRAAWVRWAALG